MTKVTFDSYIKQNKVLCDGAFGTYYAALTGTDEPCEMANLDNPELVKKIHREYIQAGARLIRTNTFAANREMFAVTGLQVKDIIKKAYTLAKETVKEEQEEVYIGGDIGPIPVETMTKREKREEEYLEICRTFLEEGAEILIFETFSDMEEILPAIRTIKEEKQDIFIIVQFCVNQFGYSNAGLSAKRLLEEAGKVEEISAAGFNCGVGPGHLSRIMEKLNLSVGKYITALPNAGYPHMIQSRMVFLDNEEYFVAKGCDIAGLGVDILGGCCGTTPSYIAKLHQKIMWERKEARIPEKKETARPVIETRDYSFFQGRKKKLIAVELAPPLNADDEKLMDAANRLKNCAVDVVTFPDSPSGRTRPLKNILLFSLNCRYS